MLIKPFEHVKKKQFQFLHCFYKDKGICIISGGYEKMANVSVSAISGLDTSSSSKTDFTKGLDKNKIEFLFALDERINAKYAEWTDLNRAELSDGEIDDLIEFGKEIADSKGLSDEEATIILKDFKTRYLADGKFSKSEDFQIKALKAAMEGDKTKYEELIKLSEKGSSYTAYGLTTGLGVAGVIAGIACCFTGVGIPIGLALIAGGAAAVATQSDEIASDYLVGDSNTQKSLKGFKDVIGSGKYNSEEYKDTPYKIGSASSTIKSKDSEKTESTTSSEKSESEDSSSKTEEKTSESATSKTFEELMQNNQEFMKQQLEAANKILDDMGVTNPNMRNQMLRMAGLAGTSGNSFMGMTNSIMQSGVYGSTGTLRMNNTRIITTKEQREVSDKINPSNPNSSNLRTLANDITTKILDLSSNKNTDAKIKDMVTTLEDITDPSDLAAIEILVERNLQSFYTKQNNPGAYRAGLLRKILRENDEKDLLTTLNDKVSFLNPINTALAIRDSLDTDGDGQVGKMIGKDEDAAKEIIGKLATHLKESGLTEDQIKQILPKYKRAVENEYKKMFGKSLVEDCSPIATNLSETLSEKKFFAA